MNSAGSSTAATAAPLLSSLVAGGLCVALPLTVTYATVNFGGSLWTGPLIIAALSGLRFAVIVGSRRQRPFEMIFFLFVYIFMGLAPLIQLRTGQKPATTPFLDYTYTETASTIVIVGIAAAAIGTTVAGRHRKSASLEAEFEPRVVNSGRAVIFGVIMLAVTTGYLAIIGLGPLLSDRSSLTQARLSAFGSPSTVTLVAAIVSMGLGASAIAQIHRRRAGEALKQRRPILLLSATLVALLVSVNPVSSPRFVAGTVLFGLATGFGLLSTIKRFRAAALAGIIALALVFPLIDANRGSEVAIGSTNPLETLSESDYDAFNQLINTVEYVDEQGITWGRQAVGVLLFWVPRGLWETKPRDTGVELAEFKGYNFTNLSAPIFSELYINGGWALLASGMAGLGWLVGKLDIRFQRAVAAHRVPGVAMCLVPFYMLIMLRGSLLQSMTYLAVILAAAAFIAPAARGSVSILLQKQR